MEGKGEEGVHTVLGPLAGFFQVEGLLFSAVPGLVTEQEKAPCFGPFVLRWSLSFMRKNIMELTRLLTVESRLKKHHGFYTRVLEALRIEDSVLN